MATQGPAVFRERQQLMVKSTVSGVTCKLCDWASDLIFSKPQFPHLYNGVTGLLRRFNEFLYIRFLEQCLLHRKYMTRVSYYFYHLCSHKCSEAFMVVG